MKDQKRDEKAGEAASGGADPGATPDPRQRMAAQRIQKANAFNKAHTDLVAKFNQATGGSCAGSGGGGVDPKKVIAWQRAHGVSGDGKVGPTTVTAAEAANGQKNDREEQAAPQDAFEGEGVAEDGPAMENPALEDNILDGDGGMEERKEERLAEPLSHAGETVERAHDGAHLAAGKFPVNDELKDGLGGEVEAESPWIKAAMAPVILEMLREGDYSGAIVELAKSFSPSEYLEGLTMACEKLGLHHVVPKLAKLAPYGAAANVGLEMVMWSYEGLKSIGEEHEKGDRDSRIAIYARAFASTFLFGEAAGEDPGAVTPEQREAVERGRTDGTMTAASTGELAALVGKHLLQKYGGGDNAMKAIMEELMRRAGFKNISIHENHHPKKRDKEEAP